MYRSPPRNFLSQQPAVVPQAYGARPGIGGPQLDRSLRTQSPVHMRNFTGQIQNYASQRLPQHPYAQPLQQYPPGGPLVSHEGHIKPISTVQQRRVIEQPLKVVDLKQYDELWQKRIAELQASKKGDTVVEERVVVQEDNSRIEQLQQENRDLRRQIQELEAGMGNGETNLNYYKRLVQELQQNLADANQTISDKNGQLRSQEGEIQELKRRLADQDRTVEQLKNKLSGLEDTNDQLSNDLSVANNQTIPDLKSRIRTLEASLGEVDSLRTEVKRLRSDNDFNVKEIARLNALLQESDRALRSRDQEIDNLNRQIEDLMNQINELEQSQSETMSVRTTLESEINTWRQKFVEANRNHHVSEEKAMLLEAELENLKKGGIKVQSTTSTTEVRKSTVPRQSTRVTDRSPGPGGRTSDYDQPALNQKDLEAIEKLTKQG